MSRLCFILFCVFTSVMSPARAGIEIKKTTGEARHVQTDAYSSDVGADGALTSIVYKGQELLKPGVGVSRGAYCFQHGTLTLNKIEQHDDGTILASADGKPSVTYTFGIDSISVNVSNVTPTPMQFVFVLDPAWNVVANSRGDLRKVPTRQSWEESIWFAGDKRVRITGGSSIWGPYMENTNVVQADIAPGQSRKMVVELSDTPATDAARLAQLREGKFVEPELVIDSPQSWQVFQRRTKESGFVRISGHIKASIKGIEVRLVGRSLAGDLPDKWDTLGVDPATHLFNSELPAPAGGWYRLQVKADGIKDVVEIGNIGVGEVFVIAGQSNSTNYGENRLEPTSGLASTFDGLTWRPASDPQPGTHDNSMGGSPWPAYADAMADHYHVPIGIASTGHGGTSINAWQPDGELFQHTLARISQLGYLGFRALLWHQGESDNAMSTDEYQTKLATVIVSSRQVAHWDFPWIVAQASYHPKDQFFKTVRDAQQHLWDQGIALPGPDTDTLTGDNRDSQGAGIHLSEKGLRAHGKLWEEKVIAWLDPVLDLKS